MPQPSTSTGIPPSDVTVSTSSSVSVCCNAASGAISFSTPVDVSACTTASTRACGLRALRVEQLLRVDCAAPRRVDAHDLRAARRATSHMRSPNTPFTPMITVSPGSSRLTKHASMPAEPVPLIGSVSVFSVRKTSRSRSAISSSTDEEVGIEMPEHRTLERFHDLGIGVRRPRPEQQPIGMNHARTLPKTNRRELWAHRATTHDSSRGGRARQLGIRRGRASGASRGRGRAARRRCRGGRRRPCPGRVAPRPARHT